MKHWTSAQKACCLGSVFLTAPP